MPTSRIDDLLSDARTHTVRKGTVLHTQRFSTEDGPGLRTTIFFKGCPLNCEWCHNPESISAKRQLQWVEVHCIHCGTCIAVCPQQALAWNDGELRIDRPRCDLCGKCVAECPGAALEMLGRYAASEELVMEALKDRAYYETSGGGVTLSGGEPTMQPAFAVRLLEGLKQQGISTALDTCGLCSEQTLNLLLPFTDLVLYDLKFIDSEAHRRYTGQDNTVILDNLRHIREWIRSGQSPLKLWVRTPLIPGATSVEENICAIGSFLQAEVDAEVARWELCTFNNLCRDKYRRLGMAWKHADTPLLTQAEICAIEQAAQAGFDPARAYVTGAGRVNQEK